MKERLDKETRLRLKDAGVKKPTLENLLQLASGKFFYLQDMDGQWRAVGKRTQTYYLCFYGKTPHEALANMILRWDEKLKEVEYRERSFQVPQQQKNGPRS